MRGLKLSPNMAAAGATFVRETTTEPTYRLWTINDDHPAMIRVTDGSGVGVAVEVWAVPAAGLAGILLAEPPGLSIGKVNLDDGSTVLGVIGEPALVEGVVEALPVAGLVGTWRVGNVFQHLGNGLARDGEAVAIQQASGQQRLHDLRNATEIGRAHV